MKKKPGAKKQAPLKIRISHTRKPIDMGDLDWQIILRKQIAEDENFSIKKTSDGVVFGDYKVDNDKTSNTYKVALRSADNSLNFCSCPDFKTNQLGTCKHIEAVLLKIKSKSALRRQLGIPYIPPYTSVYLDYRGERKVKLRIGTENGGQFKKLASAFFNNNMVLLESSFLQFEIFLQKAHRIHPEFRCYSDALEYIVQERNSQHRQQLVAEKQTALFNGISKARLFRYQEKGVLFAVKAGRCILADDMGLGKTLQAIVSTEVLRKQFNINTALIICPTSLKYQWKTEIEKFTGNKNVIVVEGNILTRKKIYNSNTADYLIVSYQMASNDFKYLNGMQADVLILDEAQRIKNWKTKTSASIKRIKTTYAFVLTGTPVENKIEDLYSLMQIVNPYMLGSLHNFLSRHQVLENDGTDKVIGYKDLNGVGTLLQDVMLRRTKNEVLKDLPKRMDKNLFVPLTIQQADLHSEYADKVAKLVKKWKGMHFLSEEDRQTLLKLLNMMRMVSDTTYILDQETNHQTKLDELQNILDEIFAMPDEKVVIFSQWERMTRLVAIILKEREVGFEYLHGGIPGKNRGELYANFTNDKNCKVFLSTDAGGVGLNLQSAAYLINLDIPWNPAVLEQRVGRIYRLGQKKNVSIINLVSKDSIEHRMLDVLKFKKGIAAGILDGGDNNIFLGEDKFKQFMKSVESVTTGLADIQAGYDTNEEIQTEKQMGVKPYGTIMEVEVTGEEFPMEAPSNGINDHQISPSTNISSPGIEEEVVVKGAGFLEGLLNILGNPESTQRLVKNITETDGVTGQTYLKLPISNAGVVENALKVLSSLFGGSGKK
ncbi:MAG: DEAD/DEAH box helicase [Ferruginibacter sp.]